MPRPRRSRRVRTGVRSSTTASLIGNHPVSGYGRPVSGTRRCSRTACDRGAVNTLTYVYADQTAVLGPLSTYAEPHAYDLCDVHSGRLSAPRGWEVLRLAKELIFGAIDH